MSAKAVDSRLPGRYGKMTAKQLEAEVAKYDRPFVALREARPLTDSQRRADARKMRRAPGRPRVGKGAARVYISVEKGLLKQIDAYAKDRGLSRSELIVRSVRATLNSAA